MLKYNALSNTLSKRDFTAVSYLYKQTFFFRSVTSSDAPHAVLHFRLFCGLNFGKVFVKDFRTNEHRTNGTGQMGLKQMGTRTNRYQDKWASEQMCTRRMGLRTNGGMQLAEQVSYKQVWAKILKTTVIFRICNAYNQRSLLFTFCVLRRHCSDLNFVIEDFN